MEKEDLRGKNWQNLVCKNEAEILYYSDILNFFEGGDNQIAVEMFYQKILTEKFKQSRCFIKTSRYNKFKPVKERKLF